MCVAMATSSWRSRRWVASSVGVVALRVEAHKQNVLCKFRSHASWALRCRRESARERMEAQVVAVSQWALVWASGGPGICTYKHTHTHTLTGGRRGSRRSGSRGNEGPCGPSSRRRGSWRSEPRPWGNRSSGGRILAVRGEELRGVVPWHALTCHRDLVPGDAHRVILRKEVRTRGPASRSSAVVLKTPTRIFRPRGMKRSQTAKESNLMVSNLADIDTEMRTHTDTHTLRDREEMRTTPRPRCPRCGGAS